ncbi:MAG: hypothetical protein M3228_14130 [Actinomycetota bacterium]|nr:hypothetical protein [Actinomycetota bacterium]
MPPLATLDGLHGDLSRRRFLVAAAAGLLTACESDATSSPAVPGGGTVDVHRR